jgi:hypothetical protein
VALGRQRRKPAAAVAARHEAVVCCCWRVLLLLLLLLLATRSASSSSRGRTQGLAQLLALALPFWRGGWYRRRRGRGPARSCRPRLAAPARLLLLRLRPARVKLGPLPLEHLGAHADVARVGLRQERAAALAAPHERRGVVGVAVVVVVGG